MEKIISSRHHTNLTGSLKKYIGMELQKLNEQCRSLTSARVILDHRKIWHSAEIILHGKHLEIEAHAEATDLRRAVDDALEKAERQLRKHLDKIKNHKHITSMGKLERQYEDLAAAELEG